MLTATTVMKAANAVATLALGLAAISCETAAPPSRETMLREMYLYSVALGDTLFWMTFVDEAKGEPDSVLFELSKLVRVGMSATLGQLGYGTGPFRWHYGARERDALFRFQRDLGIPATGRLDSLTVSHLARAERSLRIANVKLPELFVNRVGPSFFAHGTWKAITNRLGYPVNTVDIVCHADEGECSIVTVQFISDELDQVAVHRDYLTVTTWDKDLMIARDVTRGITMTINVPANEVVWTQVTAARSADGLFPARDAEQMTLRLVGGMRLSPPSDGGDLREVHEALFKDKDRYIALLKKNMLFEEARR